MAIRQLPSGKYRAEITKNYIFIQSKTFPSKQLAEKYFKDYHNKIEVILNLSPKKLKKLTPVKVEALGGLKLFTKLKINIEFITFQDLHNKYMAQWMGKDQVNQAIRARYWLSIFENKAIKDIKAKHIRTAINTLKSGVFDSYGCKKKNPKILSNNTVLRYRSVLSAIFKYAIEQMYLKKNPVDLVKIKATPNKIVRYLSDPEREALLSVCKTSSWKKLYLLVLMAMTTGMRKSEMMNLKWGDIDFNKSLAIIENTKNGEPRINAIPDITMIELKKFRKEEGLIFSAIRIEEGIKIETQKPFRFRKRWKAALEQAKINNFRFHDLRHTNASYLIMNGASLKEVAEVLGHKSTQTTDRYAHLSTEHKSNLINRVMGDVTRLTHFNG